MFMVGGLLDFVVNVVLLLLVIRFFLEDYTYYGFGPFLQTIYQITDFFCKPLRSFFGFRSLRMQRAIPWMAIGLILIIRGFWWSFSTAEGDQSIPMHAVHGVFSSCLGFADMIYILVVGLLVAAVLLSKEGIVFYSSPGYQAFQENTFRLFRITQGYLRTHDLWRLLGGTVAWLAACHFVAGSVLSLSILRGPVFLIKRELFFQLGAASTLLQYYYFVLLVAIIISWVNPDPRQPVVAVVRGLAEPYLRIFRMLCPWARIGMIDFSPIVAFFVLILAQQILSDLARSFAGTWARPP